MRALFEAIKLRYDAACEGELYTMVAPPEAIYPYATLQLVNSKTDDFASSKAYTDNMLFQFNLFDDSGSMGKLLNIYAMLIAAFDYADLTVVGENHLSCVRENTMSTKVDNVWQLNVTYRIKLRS